MKYLLSIVSAETGDVADVDVDLETLKLSTEAGQAELCAAVCSALEELELFTRLQDDERENSRDDGPDTRDEPNKMPE